MATIVLVWDVDLEAPNVTDSRRLEVVVDGLLLFGVVSWLWTRHSFAFSTATGLHGAAADVDGVVLQSARRRQERTFPELVPTFPRKVGGVRDGSGCRWSDETRPFLSVGQSQGVSRDSDLAEACGAGVADALVCNVVVCCREGSGDVALGPSLRTRFWRVSLHVGLTEVALCSLTSACAAIASAAEWSSIRAARRLLSGTLVEISLLFGRLSLNSLVL